MKKQKLAIVSTFDELCGIAEYTKALIPQLSHHYDIEVFELDQSIFRHNNKKVQKLADESIENICKKISLFDAVNIQLEHGTFGKTPKQIYRRILKLIAASPNLAITFHTIISDDSYSIKKAIGDMFKKGPRKAWVEYTAYKRNALLGNGIYAEIRKKQKANKKVSVIVHTKRDARMLKLTYELSNVFDHPLAYYSDAMTKEIRATTKREYFSRFLNLQKETILLGCFGFIGRYKGINTVLDAMLLLPNNYHLAIFGGVHPETILKNQSIDPFIGDLLEQSGIHKEVVKNSFDGINITISGEELVDLLKQKHPQNISDRIHFMGTLSDQDFTRAMAICDTIVLPYIEVGQSSSGPMSMAVEMRKHIIASRTKAFMQYARYNERKFSMFDVGNYLELSQLILSETTKVHIDEITPLLYNVETNAKVYIESLS